jgi:tetratricopeptide (TPR) repeat protein
MNTKMKNKTNNQTKRQIEKASELSKKGQYKEAIELVTPLLNKKMSLKYELNTKIVLWNSYANIGDIDSGVPFLNDSLILTDKTSGPFSDVKQQMLTIACNFYRQKDMYKELLTYALELNKIHEHIGKTDLKSLKDIVKAGFEIGDYKLVINTCEKIISIPGKKSSSESAEIMNMMMHCHKHLNQWVEAFAICKPLINLIDTNANLIDIDGHREDIGNLFLSLKQFEMAKKFYYDAYRSVSEQEKEVNERLKTRDVNMTGEIDKIHEAFGKALIDTSNTLHEDVIRLQKCLEDVNELIKDRSSGELDTDHNFRLCNHCEMIMEGMMFCTGCMKAWYCNEECQLADWTKHKPNCYVCQLCDTIVYHDPLPESGLLYCSRCIEYLKEKTI